MQAGSGDEWSRGTYVGNGVRSVCQSALKLRERVARSVGRGDARILEPLVGRVLNLRLDDRLDELDDGRFGRVDVLEAVAVGRGVVPDVVGGETGLS